MTELPLVVAWTEHSWEALSLQELYAILAARAQVFVVEQSCPYQDLDGLDELALHVTAWDAEGRVLAYARLTPPGSRFDEPSIGRVISQARVRRTGLGLALMARMLKLAARVHPGQALRISAQQYLQPFYERFGFRAVSALYLEDGIVHVEMLRVADEDSAWFSASPD